MEGVGGMPRVLLDNASWVSFSEPAIIVGVFLLVIVSFCFCLCRKHYKKHGTISLASWTQTEYLQSSQKRQKKKRRKNKRKHGQADDAHMPFLEEEAQEPELPASSQPHYADGLQ